MTGYRINGPINQPMNKERTTVRTIDWKKQRKIKESMANAWAKQPIETEGVIFEEMQKCSKSVSEEVSEPLSEGGREGWRDGDEGSVLRGKCGSWPHAHLVALGALTYQK